MVVKDDTTSLTIENPAGQENEFSDTGDIQKERKQTSFDCPLEALPKKTQERYQLIRSIGFGGMKCVLLVHDRDTNREIAMALMPDFKERPARDTEQFIREARITAYLNHPNIVAVHDIGMDDNGAPYYTMSYLRGLPLTTVLKRIRENRPFETSYYTLDRRLRIFQRVCNAVNYAHSINICHLDIKPDNVNVGEFGEIRLFDWGLACETDEKGNALLKGSALKGSPGYMSPEQISTNPEAPAVGKSSDIFSLGALLYTLLCFTPPFSGKSNEEVLFNTMTRDPLPFSKAAPKGTFIPRELELICRKALAKDPAQRFASVSEMRQAVMSFQSKSFQKSFERQRSKYFWSVVILLGFILCALALFFVKNF